MQDKYAGDIGDFGKFALLSELAKQGLSIGINWYKTESSTTEKNNDGRYIKIPQSLQECDPTFAKKLLAISESENRSIRAIEEAQLVPEAVYFGESVSASDRLGWHNRALAFFKDRKTNLVFLDPDNGLLVPSVKKHQQRSKKYCFYEEVAQYIEQGFSVLVYNHRSRKAEIQYFQEIEARFHTCLKNTEYELFEITFPRFSVRDYFAIAKPDHSEKIRKAFSTMLSGKWVDSRVCQKPLTMGPTYSEYRSRFILKKDFLRHYQTLPEEIVREMINATSASTSIKACMYSLWKR